ncbi:hypothetical protein SAMN05444678_11568 [Sphingomonas sp. YR710]|jgi:hypothetical protein|uniref:hypothetical protein n=1 Tax=Sphingomonas sp. YR710 TaxID=1882773 RepID=UPI0008876C17|nr:hypothetical protein [Sphingomonas sp. YR710]SDD54118.1 hypothetical protein SAMN05444678_11568 [Sphingomonas sp. YR710]
MSRKPTGSKGKAGAGDKPAVEQSPPAKVVRATRVRSAKDAVDERPVTKPAVKINGTASREALAGTVAPAAAGSAAVAISKRPVKTKASLIPPENDDSAFASEVAAQAAVPPHSPVRIFQIFYEPWHRDLLDPAFEPFDNCGVTAELMEFDVFERISRSTAIKGADYWGALSWRFTEKTGLTGADLIKIMEAHPDVDVFYCNPHVNNEALFHNMWVQGETCHVNFLEISKALFTATGLPTTEFDLILPSASFSSANYFIARPAFWEAYLPFIRKVITLAEQKLAPNVRQFLHSQAADDRGLHGGSTYLPFIVERLFPLFMRTIGAKLKGHRIVLPTKEQELNIHLRLLRDMKDVAIRTKSPWLAACWVNYRSLYFSQHHGREWCQKYLRAITPTQIKFP